MKTSLRATHRQSLSGGRVSAFTLTELLAVISIISILAAWFLSAVDKSKDYAKGASCKSALRQMGLAFAQYTADNQERYPFTQAYYDGNPPTGSRLDWIDVIRPYYSFPLGPYCPPEFNDPYKTQVYHCPASTAHYGYNSFGYLGADETDFMGLGPIYPVQLTIAVRESRVESPSDMFLVGEAPREFSYSSLSLFKWDFYATPQGRSYTRGNFHGKKCSMVYCDAHVEALNPEWVFIGPASDSSWNIDNRSYR